MMDVERYVIAASELADSGRQFERAQVYATIAMAAALDHVADQLMYLGNGNAATSMGAIEGLAMMTKEERIREPAEAQ